MNETNYQRCHHHLGGQERATAIARKLLLRDGAPRSETVKELRRETDMPLSECAKMMRCMWRDMECERLRAENARLRKLAQRMWRLERFGCYGCRRECDAESCYANDCEEAVEIEQEMRDLGIEVGE